MALTNDDELAKRMELFRSHGITRNPSFMTEPKHGPWYYQQITLGFNYRMADLQAALGVSQMKRLDQYVAKRHEIAKCYDLLLRDLPITLPWQHPDTFSAYHLYVVRLRLEKIKTSTTRVFERLRAKGIAVNIHYIPVHTQPYYQQMGFKLGDFPESEQYYREAISIPIYPALTPEKQDFVVSSIQEAISP